MGSGAAALLSHLMPLSLKLLSEGSFLPKLTSRVSSGHLILVEGRLNINSLMPRAFLDKCHLRRRYLWVENRN